MLELATLGLLQREPLHGYRLKQELELFMSSSISVNYGAIYPLLKRLEKRGDIATVGTDQTEAGPSRKTYCITAKGVQRWYQKMIEHPHESWVNGRSRFFIKFFFFGYLEQAERIRLLEHRLSVCQLRLKEIELKQLPLNDFYQQNVLQHCSDVLKAEIQWLHQRLGEEQTQPNNPKRSVKSQDKLFFCEPKN